MCYNKKIHSGMFILDFSWIDFKIINVKRIDINIINLCLRLILKKLKFDLSRM